MTPSEIRQRIRLLDGEIIRTDNEGGCSDALRIERIRLHQLLEIIE